uniref:Uncharacterized protein LOC104213382 n=1 Tax=Nicotiana sylvestris TaxID=4096 RepID=A0A1U7UYT4_NICSY|nr:PREDICTED: uncharacterized protein LOC104213382 [Nicotiana sylvestris]
MVNAMQQEIQDLEDNKTWDIVDLPKSKTPRGCKWVYKVKYKINGEVKRFKARLVAKGFSQKEGLDYKETFSPVAKMVTVRSVIAAAASKHWHIYQMDVHNAFLQGGLFEEVYMHLPQGFGTKGESRAKQLIQAARDNLQKKFKMKDLGELRFFISIEFDRSKAGILMNQCKYALDLISDSGLGGAKPVSTSLEVNQKLTSVEFDEATQTKDNEDTILDDVEPYQRLVGRLLYFTMTRPDIAYVLQVLSQFMYTPKMSHMNAALRVIRYVKNAQVWVY